MIVDSWGYINTISIVISIIVNILTDGSDCGGATDCGCFAW